MPMRQLLFGNGQDTENLDDEDFLHQITYVSIKAISGFSVTTSIVD